MAIYVKTTFLTSVTPFDLGIFFHLVTFVEIVKTSHVTKFHDNTLQRWWVETFFCEKRFLTLFDLRWPLTPCWSRDIFGLAHCYFGPSLMKIGHKTWEIWTIKVLKERFSDFRKTTVQKQTIGDCIANGIRPRARAVFWAWFVAQNMTIIMIHVDKYFEGNPLCFTNFNQCK